MGQSLEPALWRRRLLKASKTLLFHQLFRKVVSGQGVGGGVVISADISEVYAESVNGFKSTVKS